MKVTISEKYTGIQDFSASIPIISKQKKFWLLWTVTIAICCTAMFACMIWAFLSTYNVIPVVILSLIFLMPSSVVTIYFIYIYVMRSDRDWIVCYIKTKHLSISPEELELLYRSLNQPQKRLSSNNFVQREPRIQTVNTANNVPKNVEDKKILDMFSHKRYLLHRIFIPLFNFSAESGVSSITFSKFVKESYEIAHSKVKKIRDFESILSEQTRLAKASIILDHHYTYDRNVAKQVADNLIAINLNHQLLYLSDFPSIKSIELKNSIFNLLNKDPDTKSLVKRYLDSQIKIALLKLFVFEKELSNIHENEELLKILTNAAFKYQNLDIIAERTYELFLDYYELQKNQFSFDSYTELMRVFFATKQSCDEFYKSEEMVFNFDVSLLSLEEITSKIINEKLYKKYDIEKLMTSILYEKADDFETLLEFIKELTDLDNKCEKIKKAAIKDDLLNGEYTSRKTSIVDVDLMTGVEFEEFLCNYFNTHGYVCTQTKASGDQGIDLVAKKDDYVLAIQAKCYTGTVGNHAIMEAVAGTKFYNANQTMVITNSTFTKSAVELAAVNNVILWDRQVLIEKLANS